ncbi:MAG: DEAD/DEAH box helicase [Magnetococcus sp. MYC-9]
MASIALTRLHPQVQRWVWEQGWITLHQVQELAIAPILAGDRDVVISAPTAAGKTEAAFLPIATRLLEQPDVPPGFRVLAISPLKALINDQFERLQGLLVPMDIPLHRRHGDVPAQTKRQAMDRPGGVLLITPESLEALFVLRGHQISSLFQPLCYLVVDELHAFIGTERGRQVQSLLHRLEWVLHRPLPRVGLSATLGDVAVAAKSLRPNGPWPNELIQVTGGGQTARVKLYGFRFGERAEVQEGQPIADLLFHALRGDSHLVFANSRNRVELVADQLRTRCEHANLPNEFWAHHGNLAKSLREDVEALLKDRERPATAICTSTLELGIDIGQVASVAQLGCPPSVASLRQRLGRSGRRGSSPMLRMVIQEPALSSCSNISDALRMETFQAVAMIQLMSRRWTEPPSIGRWHLSTLVQQLLSLLAQLGSIRPGEAWRILCGDGPFTGLDVATFKQFLRELAGQDLIVQDHDGSLVLGLHGEGLVNHYSFYAAFSTPEEYRLVYDGKTLGSLPVDFPIAEEQQLVFAGRRWIVYHVDEATRTIDLHPGRGGIPPKFGGQGGVIQDPVRQEMRALYQSVLVPPYLDSTAQELLAEGRMHFQQRDLSRLRFLMDGQDLLMFPWCGDRTLDTLVFWLRIYQVRDVHQEWASVRLARVDEREILETLRKMVADGPPVSERLAQQVVNKQTEKFHSYLSQEMLDLELANDAFDVDGAWRVLHEMLK